MENKPFGNTEKDRRSKALLFTIIAVLLATNIGVLVMYLKERGNRQDNQTALIAEQGKNNSLEATLAEAQTELDKLEQLKTELESQNKSLNADVLAKVEEIKRLKAKYQQQGKLDEAEVAKLNQELAELKDLIKRYEAEIAQLKEENATLTTTVDSKNRELDAANDLTKQQKAVIDDQNRRLTQAAKLKTTGLQLLGVKDRWIGNKEVTTDKAGAVERLKVAFKIAENSVAEKGVRELYVRVIQPDGTTINAGGGTFTTENNEDALYSFKQDLVYEQSEKDVKLYWKNPNGFKKGNYSIEVYCDNYKMGSGTISLK